MPDSEDRYPRRIAVILLADVSDYSTLIGEDDERTARAVSEVQALVQSVAAQVGGHAEARAGDGVLASFESVIAAVDAGLRVQRLLAGDRAEPPLRLRIGIHLGDVLVTPDGMWHGDAINVAARLCALARPGTVCVSEGIYRQVRGRFGEVSEDLGRQRLKNISDPVHAYLIAPGDLGPPMRRRSSRSRWLGVAVVAAIAAAAVWLAGPGGGTAWRERSEAPEPAAAHETAPTTLGVMLFKPLGNQPANDWMREALRDGLNSQLSGLSKVKVYSKEFLDFLITRESLTEIEAANRLGITKMVSGSFVTVGDTLRIETHVVDVASGVLESAHTTSGPAAQFLTLQTRMAENVIARLDLPVTPEERKALTARQASHIEALKMLLEAEGGDVAAPATGDPQSYLRFWRTLLVPTSAHADDRASIVALLETYRQAMEARETQAVADLYAGFSPELRVAQQRYFDNVRDLKVVIADVDVAVVGDEAVVTYTRIDDFADSQTGRPMHVSLRLTKKLKRTADGWRLVAG